MDFSRVVLSPEDQDFFDRTRAFIAEHVTDEVISSVLANTKATAQEAVDTLVAGALDDGGTDNVTVLVIRHS